MRGARGQFSRGRAHQLAKEEAVVLLSEGLQLGRALGSAGGRDARREPAALAQRRGAPRHGGRQSPKGRAQHAPQLKVALPPRHENRLQ